MQPYNINPYYFQNNLYTPQQNLTQQYQERLAQLQAQYNPQPTFNQAPQQYQTFGLNGEVVDSIDVCNLKYRKPHKIKQNTRFINWRNSTATPILHRKTRQNIKHI